jgi:hypothetical protein
LHSAFLLTHSPSVALPQSHSNRAWSPFLNSWSLHSFHALFSIVLILTQLHSFSPSRSHSFLHSVNISLPPSVSFTFILTILYSSYSHSLLVALPQHRSNRTWSPFLNSRSLHSFPALFSSVLIFTQLHSFSPSISLTLALSQHHSPSLRLIHFYPHYTLLILFSLTLSFPPSPFLPCLILERSHLHSTKFFLPFDLTHSCTQSTSVSLPQSHSLSSSLYFTHLILTHSHSHPTRT